MWPDDPLKVSGGRRVRAPGDSYWPRQATALCPRPGIPAVLVDLLSASCRRSGRHARSPGGGNILGASPGMYRPWVLVDFSKFAKSCHCHHSPASERSHRPEKILRALSAVAAPLQPRQALIRFPSLRICLLWTFRTREPLVWNHRQCQAAQLRFS